MPLTWSRGVATLVLVCSLGLGPAEAWAQARQDFSIERFRLAIDGSGILDVNWAGVPGHNSWGLGAWASFAHDPLVLYDDMSQPSSALVGQRVTTGIVGAISLWDRLQLGASFDAVGYQASGTVTDGTMQPDLPSAGAGDLRFAPKLVLVGDPRAQFHVALIAAVSYPIGAASGYLRETGPTVAPELALSWSSGAVLVAGNLGVRFRERLEVGGIVVDDEVFARAGAGVQIGGTRVDPAAQLDVSMSFAAPMRSLQETRRIGNETAAELMAGGSVRLSQWTRMFVAGGVGLDNGFGTPDWRAIGGIRVQGVRGDRDDDKIADLADRCPDEAEDKDGFQDDDGCPDLDDDSDGIADKLDRCRLEPEDKDGFEDADGCPELDNDGDGVADASDKCPLKAEDKDGFQDEDGCVDPSGVITGKIVDPEQRPIANVTVAVEQLDHPAVPPAQVVALDDGTFVASVHDGPIKLVVSAQGYETQETTRPVVAGRSTEVVVTLARVVRQGQLRGQILSFNGKPLAATIAIAGRPAVTADAEGLFSIDLPEGKVEVSVTARGHKTQRRTIEVKVDRVTVMNVDMRRGK
jgi:hypothetical protein